MIPNDLAARLRLMAESVVRPVAPAHEIASDLPDFPHGQRFTARIEATLPDGTFRAVVAGRNLTLSLPESAKAGDTLELIVTERTPRLIVARRAGEAAAQQEQAPATTLSRTGRLISSLLASATGTMSASARPSVPLGGSTPLLPHPPAAPTPGATLAAAARPTAALAGTALSTTAAPLAAALQQAISESGLFYEAHQAQWVTGRYPLQALLREPQGRHPRAPQAPARAGAAAGQAGPAVAGTTAEAGAPTEAAERSAPLLPAELQPLVQQQLEAAATQRIAWHGEIWPGQTLHWEITEETPQGDAAAAEEPAQWSTTLRLTLRRLGELSVALRLTPDGVRVALSAPERSGAGLLRDGQAELSDALAAAGVPLLSMSVESREPA